MLEHPNRDRAVFVSLFEAINVQVEVPSEELRLKPLHSFNANSYLRI
jgi:hypothetical protein